MKEEGRRKKEEGRRKREEGRRKREKEIIPNPGLLPPLLSLFAVLRNHKASGSKRMIYKGDE
ncbi:MAG: hypothetical protein ACRC62_32980 [Microcoleus sp.]